MVFDPQRLTIHVCRCVFHLRELELGSATPLISSDGTILNRWASSTKALSALEAELLAVEFGLKRAQEAGLKSFEVLSDSLPTVQAINKASHSPVWGRSSVFWSIMGIQLSFDVVNFIWIPRSVNVLAYDLCCWARKTNFSGVFVD